MAKHGGDRTQAMPRYAPAGFLFDMDHLNISECNGLPEDVTYYASQKVNPYRVYVSVDGKVLYLGQYCTAQDAGSVAVKWREDNDKPTHVDRAEEPLTKAQALAKANVLGVTLQPAPGTASGFKHVKTAPGREKSYYGKIVKQDHGKIVLRVGFPGRMTPEHAALDVAIYLSAQRT